MCFAVDQPSPLTALHRVVSLKGWEGCEWEKTQLCRPHHAIYSRVGKNRACKPAEKESMKRVLGSPVPTCRGTVCLEVLRVRERHRHTHHHRAQGEVQAASCAFTAPSDGIRTVSYCVVVVPTRGQDIPTCEPTAHPHREHQRAMSDAGTPWIDGTRTRRLDVLACTAKCCPYDILANAANPQTTKRWSDPKSFTVSPRPSLSRA